MIDSGPEGNRLPCVPGWPAGTGRVDGQSRTPEISSPSGVSQDHSSATASGVQIESEFTRFAQMYEKAPSSTNFVSWMRNVN